MKRIKGTDLWTDGIKTYSRTNGEWVPIEDPQDSTVEVVVELEDRVILKPRGGVLPEDQ